MTIPKDRFKSIFDAMSTDEEIEIILEPSLDLMVEGLTDAELSSYLRNFHSTLGYECPSSITDLLALPHIISFIWRKENDAGEFRLLEPFGNRRVHVDSSYSDIVQPDITQMQILDQVTDIAGPWFVLYDFATVDQKGLYLFDGQNLGSLSLAPIEYVNALSLGAGFNSWQFLFSDLFIAANRRKAMISSFAVVQALLPDRDYTIFTEAFAKLGSK